VLDEAFAGIDRPMRAQLMGLLAEFDLDFMMTSHDEWGFYQTLDGLSTYHLARDPSLRGVYADWFLWDGTEGVRMEGP
jgi:ABC-type Mn2+/Zn2+ transport system ATPase subunit